MIKISWKVYTSWEFYLLKSDNVNSDILRLNTMKNISQTFFDYYTKSVNPSGETTYIYLDKKIEDRIEIDILEDICSFPRGIDRFSIIVKESLTYIFHSIEP